MSTRLLHRFPSATLPKNAWQVLSEELGDGDLDKNHVHVFVRLLDTIGAHLPRGDSVGFTHESLGLDDIQQWKAGLTQLLISLFPHDFLPEMLGFNMHFELIAVQTLKASKELAELKMTLITLIFMLRLIIPIRATLQ